MTRINLELNFAAQKMAQQVIIHNDAIEAEISKGIQMAMEEILGDDKFHLNIKAATISTVEGIIHERVFSYELKQKIRKLIDEKIEAKVGEYADRIAEHVTSNLSL